MPKKSNKKKGPAIDYGPIADTALLSGCTTVASTFGILLLSSNRKGFIERSHGAKNIKFKYFYRYDLLSEFKSRDMKLKLQ